MTDILDLIDHALDDYQLPDAMRWAPDEPAVSPEPKQDNVTWQDETNAFLCERLAGLTGTLFVGGPLHGQVRHVPGDEDWVITVNPDPPNWCIEYFFSAALPNIATFRYRRRLVPDAEHRLFAVYAIDGADDAMLQLAILSATGV